MPMQRIYLFLKKFFYNNIKIIQKTIYDLGMSKYLIYLNVYTDLKIIYKQTILGPIWLMIQPIISSLIFIFFGNMIGIKTMGVPHVLFYISGISIWYLFSQSLMKVSNTFINNSHIFSKVYFPRVSIPISYVISSFFRYVIQLLVLIIFIIYFVLFRSMDYKIGLNIFMLIPIIFHTQLLAFGVGLIFTSLTIKYRDLSLISDFIIQLWMYITPVMYFVPNNINSFLIKFIFSINPMAPILNSYRNLILGFDKVDYQGLFLSSIMTVVILIIGLNLFYKTEKSFVDII